MTIRQEVVDGVHDAQEAMRNIQYSPVDADEGLRAPSENSERSLEKVERFAVKLLECWDSEKDHNQGMNLIMELFERGLCSMRAVAVGTEERDLNDVTHLARPLTCLDHVLCGDRLDDEPLHSDLDASGQQGRAELELDLSW